MKLMIQFPLKIFYNVNKQPFIKIVEEILLDVFCW